MVNQQQDVGNQEAENCLSIATDFVLNKDDSDFVKIVIIFNIVLNVVLMITASLGNGMIIVAILRSQNLQTPSYLLITSLAFADLLVGLVFHPFQLALAILNQQADVHGICRMIRFYIFVALILGFASLLMVTCISIDRYLALTLRHRYNIIVTKKRVCLLIPFVWIVAFFLSFPATIESVFESYYILGSCLGSSLLLITSIFYIKSYRALHLYTVQVQAQQPNPLADGNFDVVRYKKTLKTMVIVLACLLLCCVPLILGSFAKIVVGSQQVVFAFNSLSFTLMSIHSSLNPIIYMVRFAEIRNACREIVTNFVN